MITVVDSLNKGIKYSRINGFTSVKAAVEIVVLSSDHSRYIDK